MVTSRITNTRLSARSPSDLKPLRTLILISGAFVGWIGVSLRAAEPPQTVAELWADFDPRAEPLEVEIVREWQEKGGTYRYVRFLIGRFKGKPSRMAAFYGFPEGTGGKLPAVMHMHGGGQRAFLEEVRTYVNRGYAALSVNWGGKEMEDAKAGDPNTDWGAVDPTQENVAGYFNLLPGEKFLVDHESPKNCNWYLLTLGCRRGITFLEQQPEVDAERIGIYGHSMGGNLTIYVAGIDSRVKVAAPSVGGQGFRTEPHEMLGGRCQQENIKGDAALFTRTLGFEHYAPRIHCPLLHLSGTNDFHGWMDDVYRTNALIDNQPLRFAFSPHLNHRFIPEVAVTRPLWLDHYLKDGPPLPETPGSEWQLETHQGVPILRVVPDSSSLPVARVDIYYSFDPDPRARFWRDAIATRKGDSWEAALPSLDTDLPLYAFANVYHTLPGPESLPHLAPITELCLSSLLHSASSAELKSAGVRETDQTSLLIDDFSRGWHDWYRLNEGNQLHWQYWTRKITDPKWRGPGNAALAITLTLPEPNSMSIVAIENEWRSYRGRKTTYVCRRALSADANPRTILLAPEDFKTSDGSSLASWSELDQLGICAHFEAREPPVWNGGIPVFHRLEWRVAGEQ
jgi:dienelactone hydrolase